MVSDYNQAMRNLSHKVFRQTLAIAVIALSSSVSANESDSLGSEDETRGVIIQEKKESRIQEFKSNGQVYMIKITPKKGFPYYLVDTDGDGILESRKNGMEPNLLIPSWVIFSW